MSIRVQNVRRGFASVAPALLALGLVAPEPGRASDALTLLGAEPQPSKRVMTESDWAASLVDALGLTQALPSDASEDDRFALLCADRSELATETGGRRVPARAAFRVSVETGRRREPGEPVRAIVSVPATALYLLSVEGVGKQRWTVDQRVVGHLEPSALGVAQAPRLLPLREGPHEVAGFLTRSGRADRVELVAQRTLCVAPADGWHSGRPLRYGAMARTLVHALRLEHELPAAGNGQPVEGEDFTTASAGGERTERRLGNPAISSAWALAGSGPAEFAYRVRLEEPGLFSLLARLRGGEPQVWSIDGRYRVTLEPDGRAQRFVWNHVMTLPLPSGEHVIRAFVPQGGGVDLLRLVPHRATDADYLGVLGARGFREGAPDAAVPRSVALASLGHPVFEKRADLLLTRAHKGAEGASLAVTATQRELPPPPAAPVPSFAPEPNW